MAACLLVFLAAGRIERLLGVTGNVVLSRLLGVILAALAVQFVIDGVRAVWRASYFFGPRRVAASAETFRSSRMIPPHVLTFFVSVPLTRNFRPSLPAPWR